MQPFIELRRISKSFPGVKALQGIDIDVLPGEVHCIVGENGAGKSTLIKIITGAYRPDEGKILIEGKETIIENPKHAMELGISCIYQELNIIPQLSVSQNIFLGREVKKDIGFFKMLNNSEMNKKAYEILKILGQDINPTSNVSKLGVGKQQMIEIAKAISIDTKLLIMDEPTSSLAEREVEDLFKVVRNLKEKGLGIIFISHRLNEVMELADRITVMRDGRKVETIKKNDTSQEELVRLMIGRNIEDQYPKVISRRGREALRIENFTKKGKFENISFKAYEGEILGIAGLVGAGRTELAKAIFGADPPDNGELFLFGKKVKINSPYEARNHGLAYLSEDRKYEGLILINTIDFNLSLTVFDRYSSKKLLNIAKLKDVILENIKSLNINPPVSSFVVKNLSGGNQQKVVVGKWLNTKARIYIFDEPTRGIDVGAKREIYNIINKLVLDNSAVILISSELPEILGISDRILVMHEGKISGEFRREDANEENIMLAMSGGV